MGNKKLQLWLPFLFSLVLAAGMYVGYQLRENTAPANNFFSVQRNSSMQEVISLIQNKYVDNVSVDSLKEEAISKMLEHLDPHSIYISSKEVQEVNEDLQGEFQGIGVEFQIFSDTVNVVNVIAGGPSEKAGVLVGDKILLVNDTGKLTGKKITADDVRGLLRGPKNSNVTVSLLRDGKIKKVAIERGTIPLPSVDASYLIAPQTAYIHINKFSETTYPEFMKAFEELQKQGVQKMLLDLRGNGGGVLQQAADIADEFLSGDKMIVYTKGTHVPYAEYRCRKDGVFENGKLVVLVDEGSASASEILSGALQDWDRAAIVGRRTFGKGLVQQQYPLSDGGALRLTVARYYTPLGRNIQKPYDKNIDNYENELVERFHDGEVVHGDTAAKKGTPFKTPAGHIVYGGGGITPDVFVPFDTMVRPKQLTELYYKNTLSDFVYHYYVANKNKFQQLKTTDDFYTQFNPGENEWKQLVQFAAKDSVDISGVPAKAKTELLARLKSLMARQIWRSEGYYEVNNVNDDEVKKALEVLNKE